jgi:hypothetical protein
LRINYAKYNYKSYVFIDLSSYFFAYITPLLKSVNLDKMIFYLNLMIWLMKCNILLIVIFLWIKNIREKIKEIKKILEYLPISINEK